MVRLIFLVRSDLWAIRNELLKSRGVRSLLQNLNHTEGMSTGVPKALGQFMLAVGACAVRRRKSRVSVRTFMRSNDWPGRAPVIVQPSGWGYAKEAGPLGAPFHI